VGAELLNGDWTPHQRFRRFPSLCGFFARILTIVQVSLNADQSGCDHVAPYPPELVEICVLASCPPGGVILDPFLGSATTALVADRLGRHCIGIELNQASVEEAKRRLTGDAVLLADRWRPAPGFPPLPPKEPLHSPPRTPAP